MPLVQLIYVSVATRSMTRDDLLDILQTARRKNSELGITGMLLYRNGYFIQALEGEESAVRELYNKIAEDVRHERPLEIGVEPIETRDFGEWSMGFKELDENDEELSSLPGYTAYLNSDEGFGGYVQSQSRARTLLRLFKDRSDF